MSTITAQPRPTTVPNVLLTAPGDTVPGKAAADEAARLALQRDFLLAMVNLQRRALAGAAAAHHVLERHPEASVLVFAVRDGRAHLLAEVLDAEGRILPARRTGEWAERVLGEVQQEDVTALEGLPGVQITARHLRVDVAAVLAAAARSQGV